MKQQPREAPDERAKLLSNLIAYLRFVGGLAASGAVKMEARWLEAQLRKRLQVVRKRQYDLHGW